MMPEMSKFKGTGVALVTPFKKDGSVDETGLIQHVEYLINNGIDYLVAMGTTSETPTLNNQEKNRVLELIVSTNNKRLPLMVGVGGNNTLEVAETMKEMRNVDFDAFLSVSPFYNKPSQEGIYAHYAHLSKNATKPIIVYNVPARTSANIAPETTLALANDFKNIIGIKEASGIMNQVMRIIKHRPDGFLVISGDDSITVPLISVGVDGVISVTANAYPKEFSKMVKHALNGEFAEAKKIHLNLIDVVQACFREGNPAGVKAVISLQKRMENVLRLPLTPVSKAHFDYIENLVRMI
ncbi:MAG: 4-hydroxy-tetrahydrodipicolinate synthase [Bacteroidales bacterium]|nr:4-hydroxy-tetrahydrodipicolinate synthase [Bacteroidales bacterium]